MKIEFETEIIMEDWAKNAKPNKKLHIRLR